MASSQPHADGGRGASWVVAQFVLIAVVAAVAVWAPPWPGGFTTRLSIAAVFVATGIALGLGALRTIGTAFTIFPRPRSGAKVVGSGPYRFVRHPMYSALLALGLAACLAGSPWALIPTAALAVVLDGKACREERWLEAVDPSYAELRRRVRWRFVPGLR